MNQRTRSRAMWRVLGLIAALFPVLASAQQVYRITDISKPRWEISLGSDLNTSGQVTGTAIPTEFTEEAFLWDGSNLLLLGTLGGSGSAAHAISDAGHVTGWARIEGDERHAYLWNGNEMIGLGTFSHEWGEGTDVNSSGQVAGFGGTLTDLTTMETRAFMWDGATMHDLGTLGGTSSKPVAINESGQVAGYSDLAGDSARHAFLWDGNTMQDLGTLGGSKSEATALNDAGLVTGFSRATGDAVDRAFLWDGNTMRDIGTPGYSSRGLAINATGQVAGRTGTGFAGEPGYVPHHAFLWDGNETRDLGTLGGTASVAIAINDSGQVTGGSQTVGDVDTHAVLWADGVMYDLNDLIDPADPLRPYITLRYGMDINNLGQILADGRDSRTGERHAYLISPPPLDVHLDLTAIPDLSGNGAAEAAVLVAAFPSEAFARMSAVTTAGSKVYVKDGATGDAISEMTILDSSWRALDLAVAPGGGGTVIGVLARKSDDSISVALHRASDGAFVREIPFFNRRWVPAKLVYVPNADGPGVSAFGVVAKNIDDNRVAVQLRRRNDGSPIGTVTYFRGDWEALDLETLNDVNGNSRPEIAVLGRSGIGQVVALVKDASDGSAINRINFLSTNAMPRAVVVTRNMGGSTAPELSVLGQRQDGKHVVQNRDSLTDELLNNVLFFNPRWIVSDISGLTDLNGNATSELAALAQHEDTKLIKAEIRDSSSGDLVRAVSFLTASWNARALAAFGDMNGNGAQELGVVARNEAGDIRVQIRDAGDGAVIKSIAVP